MEVVFWLSFVVTLLGAAMLVTQKHAVYALLGLLIAFFGSAGVFLALDAPFVAVSQILIYAGALAVMFLFVLMFTDTRTEEDKGLPGAIGSRAVFDPATASSAKKKKKGEEKPHPLSGLVMPKPMAVVVSLSLLVCMVVAIMKLPSSYNAFGELPSVQGATVREGEPAPNYDTKSPRHVKQPDGSLLDVPRHVRYGETAAVSHTIFEGFPLAFEVVSLLIFAAVLGAVLLARRHLAGIPGTQDTAKEQEHA
ncbi:MAG: NADH-quinone oxidoreductase subunit J [Planctomycetes bacterium]|nr:NADH-quinone oxidoreductase subunit J [Planctomycetota bacterium]MCB9934167.1 NADH-quinone oxidoreductase subunit J [Planctomycetota bacterium]